MRHIASRVAGRGVTVNTIAPALVAGHACSRRSRGSRCAANACACRQARHDGRGRRARRDDAAPRLPDQQDVHTRRRIGTCMSAIENPTVTIAPGVEMPLVGLGTWQAGGRGLRRGPVALERRLPAHRHGHDVRQRERGRPTRCATAACRARRSSSPPSCRRSAPAASARPSQQSLDALGLDHVDLWLIHWPPSGRRGPASWERSSTARDDGLTRAIGVSNYPSAQIDELIAATGVTPGGQPDRVVARALRRGDVLDAHRERGVRSRATARSRAPTSATPRARRDRRAPRRHAGTRWSCAGTSSTASS